MPKNTNREMGVLVRKGSPIYPSVSENGLTGQKNTRRLAAI